MANNRFKFVSPGVFINEIDNSQLPQTPAATGPLVIGRARRGPAMQPVTVSSFSEFVEVFGEPLAGGETGDIWRDGNKTAPTFGAFAAQAWLKNNPTLTYVRLLGRQHPDASDGSAASAGWTVGDADSSLAADGAGAWGLMVFPSASVASVTGTLAGVFYCNEGRVLLSGSSRDATGVQAGCTMVQSDSNGKFTAAIVDSSGATVDKMQFNFNPSSARGIRKVFNTNPTLVNSAITAGTKTYFLGESYERNVSSTYLAEDGVAYGSAPLVGMIVPMEAGALGHQGGDHRQDGQKGGTGWFISQDLSSNFSAYEPENMQKLFRLEALSIGEDLQKSYKVSISNVKAPVGEANPYGSFSVVIRKINDTDNRPVVVERFDNLNLNPASEGYISKKIGDRYEEFDAASRTNTIRGSYANRSNLVRVEVNEDVARGATDTSLLPFGVFGHSKPRDVLYTSGSNGLQDYANGASAATAVSTFTGGKASLYNAQGGHAEGDILFDVGAADIEASIKMPEVALRAAANAGSASSTKNVYWGAYTGRSSSDSKFDAQVVDYLRAPAQEMPLTAADVAAASDVAQRLAQPLVTSWVFSLDDVVYNASAMAATYLRGARAAETAYNSRGAGEQDYKEVLSAGFNQFSTVFHGGSDGLDILEREPFANRNIGTDETLNYELHSIKRAIDICSDAEQVQFNVATIPGVTKPAATNHLLATVEDRGDAIAIIDLEDVYDADTESAASEASRNDKAVSTAVNSLNDRAIDSSYAACYYPWVRIQDTIAGRSLWAPPSIVALGAYSYNDKVQAPWFAPAGFTRGGLSEGAAGLPVLDTSKRLTADDRDDLYEANINPIAKFPAEGIVIFGQKTLQATPSALDRVNVRRLMIHLKREISFIASRLLFDPNTKTTWNRFKGEAEPLLRSVKTQFGLDDFKLILDETTTTPDMVDRNAIYAKILLKPTRSVEFFALDFVITNSGASFDD
jgi:hypothetical protein